MLKEMLVKTKFILIAGAHTKEQIFLEVKTIKCMCWIHRSLLPCVALNSSYNCCCSSPREGVPYVFIYMWHIHTATA